MNGGLFAKRDLSSFLVEQESQIRQNIQAGDFDDDIQKDQESVVEQLCKEHEMKLVSINPTDVEQERTCQDDMITVSFYTTFEGDPRLLKYWPSENQGVSVSGMVKGDRIAMVITGQSGRVDFKRKHEQWRESLEYHSNRANKQADKFNRRLHSMITAMVKKRLEQIRKMDDEINHMGLS